MNTRHAEDDGKLNQGRYMSDPFFVEARGLHGHLVAEKARLLVSSAARGLLFFIQAASMQPGGLARVGRELLEMFPDRLGTPTMHRLGMKARAIYRGEVLRDIQYEMFYKRDGRGLDLEFVLKDMNGDFKSDSHQASVEECRDRCRDAYLETIEIFLSDLCLDPRIRFNVPGEEKYAALLSFHEDQERDEIMNGSSRLSTRNADEEFGTFRGVISALIEYKNREESKAISKLADTSISRSVFSTLDFAVRTRGMVLIEGNARIGKTTSAAAWCSAHTGRARFVSLVDAPDEGGFYRAIARALGLPCTYTRKVNEMRDRANDMLKKSGIMLVLDEAHYLFPQHSRSVSIPHRINWIMTALCNQGVPVALVTTPQFVRCQRNIERKTGWTSEQFRGRLKRFISLPTDLPQDELEAVARFHLPMASTATIRLLTGHARATTTSVSGIVNAIDSARYEAEQRGSDTVTFEDVEKAIASIVIPSDQAMTIAYSAENRTAVGRRSSRPRVVETPLQSSGNTPADDLQRPLTRVMSPRACGDLEDIGGRIKRGERHVSMRGQLVPA